MASEGGASESSLHKQGSSASVTPPRLGQELPPPPGVRRLSEPGPHSPPLHQHAALHRVRGALHTDPTAQFARYPPRHSESDQELPGGKRLSEPLPSSPPPHQALQRLRSGFQKDPTAQFSRGQSLKHVEDTKKEHHAHSDASKRAEVKPKGWGGNKLVSRHYFATDEEDQQPKKEKGTRRNSIQEVVMRLQNQRRGSAEDGEEYKSMKHHPSLTNLRSIRRGPEDSSKKGGWGSLRNNMRKLSEGELLTAEGMRSTPELSSAPKSKGWGSVKEGLDRLSNESSVLGKNREEALELSQAQRSKGWGSLREGLDRLGPDTATLRDATGFAEMPETSSDVGRSDKLFRTHSLPVFGEAMSKSRGTSGILERQKESLTLEDILVEKEKEESETKLFRVASEGIIPAHKSGHWSPEIKVVDNSLPPYSQHPAISEPQDEAEARLQLDRRKSLEPDPFDNQTSPLPGTEAYGMVQVDDEETFQDTAQSGNGLGAQFKSTWQEWQERYKGLDPEQHAPSEAGSHSSSLIMTRRKKHWSTWVIPPMIHPFSRAHRDINVVIILAIVYTMLTLPFQLCFDVNFSGGWLSIEFLVDVIFLADVAMNFRTGYVEKHRTEIKDGLRIIRAQRIVMRPRKVARHYLRTWFVLDVISSLPYDLLLVANVGHKTVNIVQFLRLFRLFRLHRLMLAQAELQETWSTTQYEIVEMVLLLFYLIYLSHLGACIFVLIGRLEKSPQRWLEQFSWNQGGEAAPLTEAKPFIKYTAAIYWSVVTLCSVGYGDIYPSTTRAERIFAILYITMTAIFLGYVGGNIAALLILRGQRRAERREKFATLHAYIEKEGIPEWLATRITVHMTRQWNLQSAEFDESQMLDDCTDELRMDLTVHWWRRNVAENDLFPHKRSFLINLLEKCKSEELGPGNVLCQAGESMRHLYILRYGTIKITEGTDSASSSSDSDKESASGSERDVATKKQGTEARHESDIEDPSSSEGPGYYVVEPGTIIGENCLFNVLVAKRDGLQAKKKDHGLKALRVKNIRMDLTAVSEDECTVLVLLISDLFDVLERFPRLVEALKASLEGRSELPDQDTDN